MPQQLLYAVFKTSTDCEFEPTAKFFENNPEDACGKLFIEQWTQAVHNEKMITMEAYLPFDHPHITLQLRGDRQTIDALKETCGSLSFSSQSLYETADSYRVPVQDLKYPIEEFIYSRVVGCYNPEGEKEFTWTERDSNEQLAAGYSSLIDFNAAREKGIAKEVALQSLPQNLIINATVTASLGDWLRLLERASSIRSSFEMKTIVDRIAEQIRKWVPEIYRWWYSGLEKKRSKRQRSKTIAA